jgi:hypothetical protein
MKLLPRIISCLALSLSAAYAADSIQTSAADAATYQPEGFLKARGNDLVWGDRVYRAIGVNVPYITRVWTGQMQKPPAELEADRKAVREMIADAARHRLAWFRMFAYPNNPAEISWYKANKEEYWTRMDEFMDLCRDANIQLMPSLGMYPWVHYRPYTGENIPAIVDPTSKTHRYIYAYAEEMLTRYKDDPNILMWEITNEGFLKADVTPTGDPRDLMTWDQFIAFYKEAATFIKRHAPNHLVTSGDAGVRPESMSRRLRERRFRLDTPRENLSNLLASQPEPLDVMRVHLYGPGGPRKERRYSFQTPDGYSAYPGWVKVDEYWERVIPVLRATNMPVVIGEFGQQHPFINDDKSASWLMQSIDNMERLGVSLMGLWVWHFPEQPEYTFDSRSHPRLVSRITEFNVKHGATAFRAPPPGVRPPLPVTDPAALPAMPPVDAAEQHRKATTPVNTSPVEVPNLAPGM